MDAVKFIEERRRIFAVTGENSKYSLFNMNTPAEDVVKEVEEWAAAHPRKTRQSVFLEQWPNCMIDNDGVVGICPRNVDRKCICDLERSYDWHGCPGCRREFWMQEVE